MQKDLVKLKINKSLLQIVPLCFPAWIFPKILSNFLFFKFYSHDGTKSFRAWKDFTIRAISKQNCQAE